MEKTLGSECSHHRFERERGNVGATGDRAAEPGFAGLLGVGVNRIVGVVGGRVSIRFGHRCVIEVKALVGIGERLVRHMAQEPGRQIGGNPLPRRIPGDRRRHRTPATLPDIETGRLADHRPGIGHRERPMDREPLTHPDLPRRPARLLRTIGPRAAGLVRDQGLCHTRDQIRLHQAGIDERARGIAIRPHPLSRAFDLDGQEAPLHRQHRPWILRQGPTVPCDATTNRFDKCPFANHYLPVTEFSLTPESVNREINRQWSATNDDLIEIGPTFAVARYIIDQDNLRPGGFVPGPTQFSIADVALWYLSFAALNRVEAMALTSELSIRFLRPAQGREMWARADLDKAGRSSIVGTVKIWMDDQPDRLVSTAQGTYAVPRPD